MHGHGSWSGWDKSCYSQLNGLYKMSATLLCAASRTVPLGKWNGIALYLRGLMYLFNHLLVVRANSGWAKNGICKGLSVIMGQVILRNFAMFLSSDLILERSGSSTCADNLMNPYIIVSVYWPLRSCLLIKNLC